MCDQRIFTDILNGKKLDLSNLPNNRVWQLKEAEGEETCTTQLACWVQIEGAAAVWEVSGLAEQQPRPRAGTARLSLSTRHHQASACRITGTRTFSDKSCPGVLSGKARTFVSPLRNGIALVRRMTRRRDVRLLSGVTKTRLCFLGLCSPASAQSHRLCKQRRAVGSFPALRWSCFHMEKLQKAHEVSRVTRKPLFKLIVLHGRECACHIDMSHTKGYCQHQLK